MLKSCEVLRFVDW